MEVTKDCVGCGESYRSKPSSNRKYCSADCWYGNGAFKATDYKTMADKGNATKLKRKHACARCGASYSSAGSTSKYCQDCLPHDGRRFFWHHIMRSYDLDAFQYAAMYFEQDGLCAVCIQREAEMVDHSHKTGATRALVCRRCNTAMGFFEDAQLSENCRRYLNECSTRR